MTSAQTTATNTPGGITATPTPTPTPTPKATDIFVLKITVSLYGITKTAFNANISLQFRKNIASKVSVDVDNVVVDVTDTTRRRLLAAGINITVTVSFPSQSSSDSAQGALNKTAFEAIVQATPGLAGVATVAYVSNPIVTTTGGKTTPSPTPRLGSTAPPRRRAAAALGPLVALAAAWAARAAAGPLSAGG